jgi:PhzF family phenazine biosynthesis protein
MLMDSFPADATLQVIAAENNLAETAFLVREGGDYRLRWFTPVTEVPLCGHATRPAQPWSWSDWSPDAAA